jgi:hypothetical protein
MDKMKVVLVVLAVVLLGGVAILGMKNLSLQKELLQAKSAQGKELSNQLNLNFLKLFVDKILDANGQEVDFETRLKLENEARRLGDAEILAQWQKFTNSKDEADAQLQVRGLLKLLVNKSIK